MKRLFLFLLCAFAIAGVLVGAQWMWTYHPAATSIGTRKADDHTPYTLRAYDYAADNLPAPRLPDTKFFSLERARAALPPLESGQVSVMPLTAAYKKAAKDHSFYGQRQNRLEPLAIVISAGVYDMPLLTQAVDNPAYIGRDADGHYLVRLPVIIQAGAALRIDNGAQVRLDRDDGAFIANFGDMRVVDARIEGWDRPAQRPAFFIADDEFRPSIVSWCGSHMVLAGSHFSQLGYFNSKSYGITYTSCSDTLYAADTAHLPGAAGMVIDNMIEGLYYGFYSYESNGLHVLRNHYNDNIVYGIDPHDRSTGLVIAYNTVRGTQKKHGIILSRGVDDSYVFENISEDNAGSGLMVERASNHNVITNNILRRNGGDGMAVYESTHIYSADNIMAHNGGKGLRLRNSRAFISMYDVISYNAKGGLSVYAVDLEKAGHARDLQRDPYEAAVSAYITHTEMTGNKESHIALDHVERLVLGPLQLYAAPGDVFTGEGAHGTLDEHYLMNGAVLMTRVAGR